jgi:(E)-4-hydroxy-3-methyl-but-2-enyl pyrophosphate reductase
MEIIVAKNTGLCYGVKRAMEMAKSTRRRRLGKVLTLGELIHNPQVIAQLENQGIYSTEDPESAEKGTIIIRSHGVAPEVYRRLKRKKIEIIDATCPIVKKIQKLVARLAKRSVEIVIVGNRRHPEIRGLIGYSGRKSRIVENEAAPLESGRNPPLTSLPAWMYFSSSAGKTVPTPTGFTKFPGES